jgi:hypothetical protein
VLLAAIAHSRFGTKLTRAFAAACPQLAEADMRVLTRGSGYDPKQPLGHPERARLTYCAALGGAALAAGTLIHRTTASRKLLK